MDELEQKRQAMGRVLRYLAYRARSEKETRDYLAKKNYSTGTIEAVIGDLKSYGYINDRSFVEDFVDYRINQGYGRLRICFEIQQKGVPKEMINEVLDDKIDEDSELNMIRSLLARRIPADGTINEKWIARQVGFLKRRGFKDSNIYNILKDYQNSD